MKQSQINVLDKANRIASFVAWTVVIIALVSGMQVAYEAGGGQITSISDVVNMAIWGAFQLKAALGL